MKGLLLKDFYMAKKYCRSFLIVIVIFLVSSLVNSDFSFFAVYGCMITGIIPSTLLAYDENSRWDVFCGTLPCTRAQMVSSKYLLGLAAQVATALVFAIAFVIASSVRKAPMDDFGVLLVLMLILPLLSAGISLPIMFKFGTSKGRLLYYITFCAIAAIAYAVSAGVKNAPAEASSFPLFGVAAVICICLYALSWLLSIRFYRKREII